MLRSSLALPGLLLLVLSCESGKAPPEAARPTAAAQPTPAEPPAAAPASAAPGSTQRYGGTITAGREASLVQVLKSPDEFKDADVITTGTVRRACSRKGCWMELTQNDGPGCRVTFKDYGFFVPTDSAGAQARVQGRLETQKVPAGRVRHLEAEGAQFANKDADGSATEVTLIASAVELTK